MTENYYKEHIKLKVRESAFNDLIVQQQGHKKAKNVIYSDFTIPQPYLTSALFDNNMSSLLFNLRCRTVKGIKDNFHSYYNNDIACELCGGTDSQEHILQCHILKTHRPSSNPSVYSHIFGTVKQQRDVTILFTRLLVERDRLLEMLRASQPGP